MERSLCVSQRLWQSMNGDQLEKEGRGVSRGAVTIEQVYDLGKGSTGGGDGQHRRPRAMTGARLGSLFCRLLAV